MGVHPPAGVLTELVYSTLATCDNSNCDLDVAFDTGTSFSSNLLLNNTGDHKLYNCTPKIVGSDFTWCVLV